MMMCGARVGCRRGAGQSRRGGLTGPAGRRSTLGLALLLTGCLTGSPSEPPRLYSPLQAGVVGGGAADEAPPAAVGLGLRLAHVTQADYLEKRMVWRSSDVEMGYHELERWSQMPSTYLEAVLARELFRKGGLHRAVVSEAAELRVSLDAFDEILRPSHEALLRASVLLVAPARDVLLDQAFEARMAIEGEGGAAVARAMAAALVEIGERIGPAVVAALDGV